MKRSISLFGGMSPSAGYCSNCLRTRTFNVQIDICIFLSTFIKEKSDSGVLQSDGGHVSDENSDIPPEGMQEIPLTAAD